MIRYSEDKKMVAVCFDRQSRKEFLSLFERIRDGVQGVKYFIMIDGLEGTIQDFIESCHSTEYRLYDNGKYNRLVRNLPTLCLSSEDWHDVRMFEESIGSFDEGRMSLFFVEPQFNPSVKEETDKGKLVARAQSHCFVRIDVLPGGDALEIEIGAQGYDTNAILDWLRARSAVGFNAD